MKNITLIFFLVIASLAHAEPSVTYVGNGRYTCSGSERECATIRQRNDEQTRSTIDRLDRERRDADYLSEQRRQNRALENIRDELRRRD